MKKKYTRFISFLIALVMICLCFPTGIIALELGDAELPTENIEEIPEEKIVELEALRESNVKHFRLPDGNYEAVSYGQAVHRKDADGVWQDINNDLSLTTVGTKQLYTTADSRVSYAKDFTANGELLTLRENGYTVSMAMLVQNSGNLSADATTVRATTVNNASIQRKAQYDTLEEAAEINNRSSIVYSNVINNTDIEYIMVGNDIKENIIVKSRADSYEYAFRLSLVGLNATLMEGGYISLTDKESGEQKYVIPAPYMYDANHEYSNGVEYALIHAGGDKYLLTVAADENWINAEERAFPVKIDPTISWDSIVYDTYVNASAPTTNYGSNPEMWIAAPSAGERNALVRITIPSLPEGATFGGATLKLKYYYEITTGSMVTSAYKITEYWSENTVTYNSQPHYSTTYLASATLSASSSVTASTPGTATYTISDAVRAWLATPSSNYGVLIKYISGSNLSVILHSYESGSNYGYISITYAYTIPDGVYALGSRFSGNRWMTVENGSTTAGAHIQQTYSSTSPVTNFDTSRLFKITRDSGSRYIIRSMLDNELTLYLSGTEVLTQTIPIVDDDVPNSKTFYLEWNGNGFIIRPYGTSTVVYLSSLSTANLTTGTVSSVGYSTKAAWNLIAAEADATLTAIGTSTDHPHSDSFSSVNQSLLELGYQNNREAEDITKNQTIAYIMSSEIFYIRTHGNETAIQLTQGSLSTTDLNDFSNDSFDNCKLVLFGACLTGSGGVGANNLVNKMNEKGVDTVIGFEESVYCFEMNIWAEAFFAALADGETVNQACTTADSVVVEQWPYEITTDSHYIAGIENISY